MTRPRKGGGVVAWLLFGAALAAVGLVGAAYLRQRARAQVAQPQPVAAAPDNHDEEVLAQAKQRCNSSTTAGCEEAHKSILTIPTGSPLRASEDFKLVVAAWADDLINRATQGDVDMNSRRAMLREVIDDPMVDDTRRKSAREHLDQIDMNGSTTGPVTAMPVASAMSTAPAAPKDAGGTRVASAAAPERNRTQSSATETHPRTVTTAAATTTGGQSAADRARAIMLNDPAGARAILEPRVASGHATKDEISLLKTICRNDGDKVCVEHCKGLLGQ